MQKPQILDISEKKLIGMSVEMSLTNNKTFQLFSTFMLRRKEVLNAKSANIFDVKVYPENYYLQFDAAKIFTKLAMIEVDEFGDVPNQMESFIIPGGLYAIFRHKGGNTDTSIFQYIFSTWMPNSEYTLDNRPHFDILSDKQNNPSDEQEIWIPIKAK